ncbi:hypothetical protein M8S83_19195 [Enterobacter asburiae]|uniref:hypothetical protein n=1 Tax=Enterobacter TaxID=547 RepID=UPI00135AE6EF|nr:MULTISPECIES: hypothetical protein [Enterobacter]ELH8606427.1 hypothetical protein [Enterobacter asburiae]EMD2765675.1 hypothetical protein [Enterobacter asburiae]EMD2768116.1 hypothetical protein [Enterobacter asburiae]MBE8909349.1 hypothetical protein [Enterobacter asburiae]MCM7774228.1 hypothetical protein [Enterobacter asburiae]
MTFSFTFSLDSAEFLARASLAENRQHAAKKTFAKGVTLIEVIRKKEFAYRIKAVGLQCSDPEQTLLEGGSLFQISFSLPKQHTLLVFPKNGCKTNIF